MGTAPTHFRDEGGRMKAEGYLKANGEWRMADGGWASKLVMSDE
jgi:hypothetical protein